MGAVIDMRTRKPLVGRLRVHFDLHGRPYTPPKDGVDLRLLGECVAVELVRNGASIMTTISRANLVELRDKANLILDNLLPVGG